MQYIFIWIIFVTIIPHPSFLSMHTTSISPTFLSVYLSIYLPVCLWYLPVILCALSAHVHTGNPAVARAVTRTLWHAMSTRGHCDKLKEGTLWHHATFVGSLWLWHGGPWGHCDITSVWSALSVRLQAQIGDHSTTSKQPISEVHKLMKNNV